MDGNRVREMLVQSDALLEGHFRYTSGRHGRVYFEKIRIAQNPALVDELGGMMADAFRGDSEEIDVVCSPAFGAIVFGFSTARHLGKPFAFLQRDGEGRMTLRTGFTTVGEGSRVLLIEDVATTGGSISESREAIEARGASVVRTGILVDRTNGALDPGMPWKALLSVEAESWEPADCPLCRQGVPLHTPGSSGRKPDRA
ncbi:MAG TPA: orotate phosphoribosyltransferase [Candidatus Fermentibacter daniensis]|mgnify:FL=1|jgi:orotate phosphoribosyltransferase|nr:orotate phosphoribosyltransferase [Candidatus Fermentibacter daniensis]HOD19801.1 orotate phosphoribosyltransferase [Candidatus Fermentibacter daniensis]HOF66471.1 orotate phosphoribosyltransferase [Candidatus Fermentibacter daniensis]HOG53958.1 orotate phosphoribosyltransferase [Candidatus Fermentibacter daniensis]HOR07557.1 orotate phosphoribosyltransferase [Candidatus Fermentibacter daniensis]